MRDTKSQSGRIKLGPSKRKLFPKRRFQPTACRSKNPLKNGGYSAGIAPFAHEHITKPECKVHPQFSSNSIHLGLNNTHYTVNSERGPICIYEPDNKKIRQVGEFVRVPSENKWFCPCCKKTFTQPIYKLKNGYPCPICYPNSIEISKYDFTRGLTYSKACALVDSLTKEQNYLLDLAKK